MQNVTDPTPGTEPPPRAPSGFFTSVRNTGLIRTDDRWIAGVCGGLAQRFGVDPLLVRAIVAVTMLLGGFGLVLYGIGWALLPEARDGRIHLEELMAGRFDIALLGAAGTIVLGFARGDRWAWSVPGQIQGLGWLVLIGCLVTLVVVAAQQSNHRTTRSSPDGAPTPAAVPPPAPAAFTGAVPTSTGPETWGAPEPSGPSTIEPATAYAPDRRPRTGPGRTTVGVVVGLSVLGLAGLLAAQRFGWFDGPVALVAIGGTIVLIGLGIVISGLRGRSSGVLGFFAIMMLIVTLPVTAAWAATDRWPGSHRTDSTVSGPSTVELNTVGLAQQGVSTGFGDVTVDLTGLDPAGQSVEVPIDHGAGQVIVLLPTGVGIDAAVSVGAGSITWQVDDEDQQIDGVAISRTYISDGTDDANGSINVTVNLGAGDLTIVQEGSTR